MPLRPYVEFARDLKSIISSHQAWICLWLSPMIRSVIKHGNEISPKKNHGWSWFIPILLKWPYFVKYIAISLNFPLSEMQLKMTKMTCFNGKIFAFSHGKMAPSIVAVHRRSPSLLWNSWRFISVLEGWYLEGNMAHFGRAKKIPILLGKKTVR